MCRAKLSSHRIDYAKPPIKWRHPTLFLSQLRTKVLVILIGFVSLSPSLLYILVHHSDYQIERSTMWWLQATLGVALLPKAWGQTDAFEFIWPVNTNQCGVSNPSD
jgi:hypothetical protein